MFTVAYLLLLGVCSALSFSNRLNGAAQSQSHSIRSSEVESGSNAGTLKYNYIVVGGGTAGLAIASRLSENPTKTVLVIEAGVDYLTTTAAASANTPALGASTVPSDTCTSPIDWCFETQPIPGLNNRRIYYSRGKTLGGSSVRNLLVYHRPTISSLNLWSELGNPGYDWASLSLFYKKSTNFTAPDPSKRPSTSPPTTWNVASYFPQGDGIQVNYANVLTSPDGTMSQALVNAGIPRKQDLVSGSLNGLAYSVFTELHNQTRATSRNTYLANASHRSNLHVLTSSLAKRIVFSQTTATGVQVQDLTTGVITTYGATDEVILSAGAFQSPQLLMVSGIGPKKVLQQNGIKVLVDNEFVGQNMWDQLKFAISYPVSSVSNTELTTNATFAAEQASLYNTQQTGVYTSAGAEEIGWETLQTGIQFEVGNGVKLTYPNDWPNFEYIPNPTFQSNFSKAAAQPAAAFPVGQNFAAIVCAMITPTSRGYVTISSNDTATPPVIYPNFLGSASDQQQAVKAFKRIRQFFRTAPLNGIVNGTEAFPGANVQTDAQILAAIQNSASTIWHASGTAAMLPQSKGGVINPLFQVYGTKNLRVVDASSFPFLPPGHPQSTIYMLAEKAASLILLGL